MKHKGVQRVIDLALEVLDRAAYKSRTDKVDTLDVRLALAVLWVILTDRKALRDYWQWANNVTGHPWESARGSWYGIKAALRAEGWSAPQQ